MAFSLRQFLRRQNYDKQDLSSLNLCCVYRRGELKRAATPLSLKIPFSAARRSHRSFYTAKSSSSSHKKMPLENTSSRVRHPPPKTPLICKNIHNTCGGMDILVRAATPLSLKTPFSAARRPLSSLNSCYPVSSAV